ncbi:MAG: hydroxyacylglutathione hydrolase [Pseudomonadota bacterium]
MTFEIVTVPCRADNYVYLLRDKASGKTALIDATEAAPVQAALADRGWTLHDIWITHHHGDHIEGVEALRAGKTVRGAAKDAKRLPPLDDALRAGGSFEFAGHEVEVMDVPGHTIGHIAFYVPDAKAVFTGDSLMSCGCGRLFEGTPELMWSTMRRLSALPEDTMVYSGHEYTQTNLRFALTIEPDNLALHARQAAVAALRAAKRPAVPTSLREEKATNPFLRAGLQTVKDDISLGKASDVEVFAEIRRRRDEFS